MRVFYLAIFLISSYSVVYSQTLKSGIKGVVVDESTGNSLPYTSIQVLSTVDTSMVAGGITDDDGKFLIQVGEGDYFLMLDFMGYERFTTEAFPVQGESMVDVGTLTLTTLTNDLDEVVVQAEKSTMELALDKRIFNVGKDLGNAGGSASEILNNIPSVTVDAEGNVALRGSSNVRILVDGKPSGLVSFKGGAGLQQLQASLVDQVEVITNPSARYEAEGMSGIINIVLKKDRKQGFNGSFELTGGHPRNIGGAANVNYRKNNLNFFINYGISYRVLPSRRSLYQEVFHNDTTFISRQSFESDQKGFAQNIRGGLDYFFSESSILTASYLFRRSDGQRYSNLLYEDYLFNTDRLVSYTDRIQDEDEIEPNNEYAITYKKEFDTEGHVFTADVRFLDNWESSDQLFTQQTFDPSGQQTGSMVQWSPNDETEMSWLFQGDYTYPFGENGKFEVGARLSLRDITNDYLVAEENESGERIPLPGFDNNFIYDENIHAIYAIYGHEFKNISYQVGLRNEWTDIETILEDTDERNPRKYTNLFPSAHLTFNLVNDHAIQLSYSRRVRRPVYRELTPYFTFADSRNFYSGNPNLNPEFSNVFELGHVKYFDKGSVASSLYYRQTDAPVQSIRLVDETGFSTTKPENLETAEAVGLEFTAGYTPTSWWKLDFNFNLFNEQVRAGNFEMIPDIETTTWFARQTSRFDISKTADLQIRANYEAPRKISQGRRKSIYFFDLAFTQEIFGEKGRLTFNVTDIFNSRKTRTEIEGQNFFTDAWSQRVVRQINMTISYRINQ